MRVTRVGIILGSVAVFFVACLALVLLHPDSAIRTLAEKIEAEAETDPALESFHESLEPAMQTAFSLRSPEEWAQADKVLVAALSNPMFAKLSKEQQSEVYSGAGWSAMRLDQDARARDMLAKAVKLDPTDSEDWRWLAKNQGFLEEYDAAAKTLVTFTKRWPEELDENKDFIVQVVTRADAKAPARLELLQALFEAKWDPKPLGASGMWRELALSKIEMGERETARALTRRITDPDDLVGVHSDKRFDGLYDPKDPRFNVEAAATRKASLLRVHADANAKDLKTEAELGRALLALGRYQEVLERSDRAITRIKYGDGPFKDVDDQKSRILNNRSRALSGLGRFEEAMAQLEQSAKPNHKGEADTNQVLNLGAYYCTLGKADDALAAARRAVDMSEYGKVVQAYVQHCAARLKNDDALASRSLAFMRTHRKHNEGPFVPALLRENRMDEAAKSVIERLLAKDTRNAMLVGLQDYLEPRTTPGGEIQFKRWDALMAREDVKRAVETVGRIRHYDYYGE